ncbi:MAG TPA: peptide-methionine (R)-S-oxide reductase MsrB [Lautropia sp.]|jgi:peptide-methionine (R)-S-oxide reductase|nr:peptide-methionine (R)-S-oxide reductase MsrB [Lautropia sp.]
MTKPVEEIQQNWRDLLPANVKAEVSADAVELGDEDWRKKLDPEAFEVLRHEGTERAFTSPLNDEHRPGVFVCAGCGQPLFTSEMKYDSGSGWPSFFTAIPGSLETSTDYKLLMPRTEYHCTRCGGHHGHVFEDGPLPTGTRFCNNGVSLKFVEKDGS